MAKRQVELEIYEGHGQLWYWHLKAKNGEIVLQGEGHPTKTKARRAAKRAQKLMAQAVIVVDE